MKKKVILMAMLVLLTAGAAFAQINLITEEQAYGYGLHAGYTSSSVTSPFNDSARTAAWRKGYTDGSTAASRSSSNYSLKLSPTDYTALFPNRNNQPATDYTQKRLGVSWSPIFKYNSKEYILGPDGVYEYVETAFGVQLNLIRK